MNPEDSGLAVIPAGVQEFGYEHMLPIARLLIDRGHLPLDCWEEYGFCPTQAGMLCQLTTTFTQEDWEAINKSFVIPDNIVFYHGLIRDNDNGVDMLGYDEVISLDGPLPAAEWEARQDWSDLPADVASAAPDA